MSFRGWGAHLAHKAHWVSTTALQKLRTGGTRPVILDPRLKDEKFKVSQAWWLKSLNP